MQKLNKLISQVQRAEQELEWCNNDLFNFLCPIVVACGYTEFENTEILSVYVDGNYLRINTLETNFTIPMSIFESTDHLQAAKQFKSRAAAQQQIARGEWID